MDKSILGIYALDLHTHSCLSPCADLEMTPRNIVAKALEMKIAAIALTDHNSAENVPALRKAARDTGLHVIAGMEITSAEEAHVVALFPDDRSVFDMQELVYARLQPGRNDPALYGDQIVANEFDEVEGVNERILLGSSTLEIEELVDAIHERGGLAIAAHIDREAYSLVGQIGFIPPDLPLDAVEISGRMSLAAARKKYPEYRDRSFISSSDAHAIEDVGTSPILMRMADPCDWAELRLALGNREGRGLIENGVRDPGPGRER